MPRVEDFESSPMVHSYGDLFNPPGLTNFLGSVQVEVDPVATRSLLFPPLSGSHHSTGGLFIDGRFFPSTGSPITFSWRPDRIVREAEHGGLKLRTTTILPFGVTAVGVLIDIENRTASTRRFELRLGLRGGVTESRSPWASSIPPAEYEHHIGVDPETRALTFEGKATGAASVQGARPGPDRIDDRSMAWDLEIAPRGRHQIAFVHSLGSTRADALAAFNGLVGDMSGAIARTTDEWNQEIEAIFTPDSGRYSGSLPQLETSDSEILKIYLMGALGVVYFKRDSPHSVMGRAYDTLMPRYWATVTYLWDYSLSSLVHALLDPEVMRGYLERWMSMDVHSHFGTEWLTGQPIGPWYSVNDFAMTKILTDYLRWSGDFPFLHKSVESGGGNTRTVLEHLESFATNWAPLQTRSGLADYGGVNNLLECVSTYVHEVASLNAANAWSMRIAAETLDSVGETKRATGLRDRAQELVKEVKKLYADGRGYWNVRFPDGALVPVRHCYDFFTVINTIGDDLSSQQKSEMKDFFVRELQTPTWMRALSAGDPDAMFSDRPDHQWNGAYTAWPPQSVSALWAMGEVELAYEWLKGLSKSANQGPFGQAHFTESAVAPEAGGAIKAPSDFPWINDWACSSNGAWVNVVIESIFGVRAPIGGDISAQPKFGPFEKDARLRNLRFRGRLYDVDRRGVHPSSELS